MVKITATILKMSRPFFRFQAQSYILTIYLKPRQCRISKYGLVANGFRVGVQSAAETEQRIRLVLIYFPKPPSTYSIHSFIQYYYLLHTYRLLAPQGSAWQTRVSPSSADARVKTGPSFVYESNCSNNFYWLLNESFFQYTKSKFCIDFFARQKSSFTRFDESKLLFQGIVTSQYIHTYYTYYTISSAITCPVSVRSMFVICNTQYY